MQNHWSVCRCVLFMITLVLISNNSDAIPVANITMSGNESVVDLRSIELYNNSNSSLIPTTWQHHCFANELLSSRNLSKRHVEIVCHLGENDFINFLSFRNFTSELEEGALFSLSIRCKDGGSIFLPFPGRARRLYSLYVSGCTLYGYHSERTDKTIDLIHDDMKYLVITNSVIMTTTSTELFMVLAPEQSSNAYECGPLNAVELTESNLRYSYRNLTSSKFNISEEDILKKAQSFHRQHISTSYRCKYKYLVSLDKSSVVGTDRQVLLKRLQNSFFPAIEMFNFSSLGIRETPVQFYDWRLLSKNLKFVDLTHNRISDISSFICHDSPSENSIIGTIDLRFNNISNIKSRNLNSLFIPENCDKLLVDIRENPFNCDCEMMDFINFLNTEANFTGRSRYKYLFDLKCFNPPSLRGKVIYNLSMEELGCEILLTTIMKAPIIVLCCFVFVFSVLVIICTRYRKEIIILAYTRMNTFFPCKTVQSKEYKKYDAFIAYSQADVHWVVYTLAKRLENKESAQNFSLCLHHRDFLVGAAISDNIVRSVESSRHTVIVVSKHFLKSDWCRLEFRVALQQSLLEKRRHLIIILLEDIPSKEFEPELKRCMQTLTYVKADDKWFWDKLIYALSDYSKV